MRLSGRCAAENTEFGTFLPQRFENHQARGEGSPVTATVTVTDNGPRSTVHAGGGRREPNRIKELPNSRTLVSKGPVDHPALRRQAPQRVSLASANSEGVQRERRTLERLIGAEYGVAKRSSIPSPKTSTARIAASRNVLC